MEEKLNEIDEILSSYEGWMHGTDGDNCTKARKLLREIQNQIKKQHPPEPPKDREIHISGTSRSSKLNTESLNESTRLTSLPSRDNMLDQAYLSVQIPEYDTDTEELAYIEGFMECYDCIVAEHPNLQM